MGLAGAVVKTAGKAALGGTKVLAKGTTKAAGSVVNSITNSLCGNNVTKAMNSASRGKQAESMLRRVMNDMDTTGKTRDGFNY